ncbi:hypothetical protein BSLG_000375 [Batrachochytrium salamandrivorans]|nr:hypothetical protein BSLG_000375 [Batrachochytrium salamandrivorans]
MTHGPFKGSSRNPLLLDHFLAAPSASLASPLQRKGALTKTRGAFHYSLAVQSGIKRFSSHVLNDLLQKQPTHVLHTPPALAANSLQPTPLQATPLSCAMDILGQASPPLPTFGVPLNFSPVAPCSLKPQLQTPESKSDSMKLHEVIEHANQKNQAQAIDKLSNRVNVLEKAIFSTSKSIKKPSTSAIADGMSSRKLQLSGPRTERAIKQCVASLGKVKHDMSCRINSVQLKIDLLEDCKHLSDDMVEKRQQSNKRKFDEMHQQIHSIKDQVCRTDTQLQSLSTRLNELEFKHQRRSWYQQTTTSNILLSATVGAISAITAVVGFVLGSDFISEDE